MFSERLQILVTKEQRDRLQAASQARGVSVGELVREAIDKQHSGPSREEKRRAWEKIKAMRGSGPAPSPEELDRIVERGAEDRARRAGIRFPELD
jgi:hypothetical protein